MYGISVAYAIYTPAAINLQTTHVYHILSSITLYFCEMAPKTAALGLPIIYFPPFISKVKSTSINFILYPVNVTLKRQRRQNHRHHWRQFGHRPGNCTRAVCRRPQDYHCQQKRSQKRRSSQVSYQLSPPLQRLNL